jgi:hypothetical protein
VPRAVPDTRHRAKIKIKSLLSQHFYCGKEKCLKTIYLSLAEKRFGENSIRAAMLDSVGMSRVRKTACVL